MTKEKDENKMRYKTIAALILATAFAAFATGDLIAQQDQHPSQTQPEHQSTGMMGGGMMSMMGQMNQMNHTMGQMMTQHQQMSDMMAKLMQNMSAMQNEKDINKLHEMMKEQQGMLDQMHTHMMQQGRMMQQMMGAKSGPESSK